MPRRTTWINCYRRSRRDARRKAAVLYPMPSREFPNAVPADRSEAPVYFLHIPKTGGSTVSGLIESLQSGESVWSHRSGHRWAELLQASPERLAAVRLFVGHFGGLLQQFYPGPLRYLTVMRDPLERAISHYRHVLRDPNHALHGIACELGSFGAYLRDPTTQPTIVNFQLRSIAANLDPRAIAASLTDGDLRERNLDVRLETVALVESTEELLETATTRLEQMCLVGLTERLEDSLALACEVFGWMLPESIERQNVAPDTDARCEPLPEDVALFKTLNAGDYALYATAKRRFERDWARSRAAHRPPEPFICYSQNGEDFVLYRALADVRNGVYVDVGANDPGIDSVTKAFYERGWRGINIEPVAELYAALVAGRPLDRNIQAAAGAAAGDKTLYEIPSSGLSTLDPDIAEGHRRRGFEVRTTTVPVRTLDDILSDAQLETIHFLKVDVEGWEHEVLAGLDLGRFRPWIIVVEATLPNSTVQSHAAWEPMLMAGNYVHAYFDGLNRFYVAGERRRLLERFAAPPNSSDNFVRASEDRALRALRLAQADLRAHTVTIDTLRADLHAAVEARQYIQREAEQQILALQRWATSADAYAKSLATELEQAREQAGAAIQAELSRRTAAEAALRLSEAALARLERHWAVRYFVPRKLRQSPQGQ